MADVKKPGARLNLRKHPVLVLFALLFFAFSLLIIVAFYLSSSSSVSSRRSRKKVNKYRLPVNGIGFMPASLGPGLAVEEAPAIRAAQADVPGRETKRWKTLLLNAALVVAGATVSVIITMLLTQTPFP